MNLKQARKEIRCEIAAGNAVLLKGPSGLGKSDLAYDTFDDLKAEGAKTGETWGMQTIFAATQTPPDLIGFQFKGERDFTHNGETRRVTITDPSVPLWMLSTEGKPAWMYDKFFLFIDEYGQGEADVKRAMAEIFLKGGTAPWYLPPGSVRLAATNVGTRYGVTKDFDFCISRRTEIEITPDVNGWLEWADTPYTYQGRDWSVMPVTKAWAKANANVLYEPEPKEQGPWCSPRTICAADRSLQIKAADNNGVIPIDDSTTVENLAGKIGMPATQSYMNHLRFLLELPQYDDVVADPDNAPVPQRPDLLLLMAYQLAAFTKVPDLGACIKYIKRMPSKDIAITYVTSLVRRDYAAFVNEPAMQGWIAQNAALMSIVQALR